MVYRVIVEATAEFDAKDYAAFILSESNSSEAARKWLAELESQIETLSEMPRRHPRIPEQTHFAIELRHFMHYSHRVVFHINDDAGAVHVLRIYHERRDELRVTGFNN